MEFAWCSKCHESVSLAHAVAEFPCPKCGSTRYLMVVGSAERDELLSEFERMMRLGNWGMARSSLECCRSNGLISDSDFNLSLTLLEWRMQCSVSASDILKSTGGKMLLEELRSSLMREYDAYVVSWLLREYRGLRLTRFGKSYLVEDEYGNEET